MSSFKVTRTAGGSWLAVLIRTWLGLLTTTPSRSHRSRTSLGQQGDSSHDPGIGARLGANDLRGPGSEEQTAKYLRLLDDIEFVSLGAADEGRMFFSGPNSDAHGEHDIRTREFNEVLLGQVVNRAFHNLKGELNLTLLAHYPKYATAYYFSALQRGELNLHIDVGTAHANLEMLYDDSVHETTVRQKLDDLVDVNVIETDGEYSSSNPDVYRGLVSQAIRATFSS